MYIEPTEPCTVDLHLSEQTVVGRTLGIVSGIIHVFCLGSRVNWNCLWWLFNRMLNYCCLADHMVLHGKQSIVHSFHFLCTCICSTPYQVANLANSCYGSLLL